MAFLMSSSIDLARALGIVFCTVTVLVACSSEDGSASATSTPRVGQACSANQACGPAEQCLTEEPGGLCVKACTQSGSAAECPSGSLCDEDSFLQGGRDQRMVVCLQACEKDEECRSGYACSGVSNASGKVCRKQGS